MTKALENFQMNTALKKLCLPLALASFRGEMNQVVSLVEELRSNPSWMKVSL
jgi:hypothetical protein